MSPAGPFPRGSHRSAQHEGTLMNPVHHGAAQRATTLATSRCLNCANGQARVSGA